MYKIVDKTSNTGCLYPPIDPFEQCMIDVGDGNKIYVEQTGNSEVIRVIVLHGGPGGGCSPTMRRYFCPRKFRAILFDQRGCGRSRPHASVAHNTTWHLVDDIEKIRRHKKIEKWSLFGGSWGATLALIYAQKYPERVSHLILRGIFLMTQDELDWFYSGGAGKFWPEEWERFVSMIPASEQDDLILAYNKRLFCGNLSEETRFAQQWAAWENSLASIHSNTIRFSGAGSYARAFARLENHYFINKGFLDFDNYILSNMKSISNIPGIIVQGRHDMICPPVTAYSLAQHWPSGQLRMIQNAGHSLSEPEISVELIRYLDQLENIER